MKRKKNYSPREKKVLLEWIENLSYDDGERFLEFCRKRWNYSPMHCLYRTAFEKCLKAFWRQDKDF